MAPNDGSDPAIEWDEHAATLVELSSDDLREIEAEEKTPVVDLRQTAAYATGVDWGFKRAIAGLIAILTAGRAPQRKIDQLVDLLREWDAKAPRKP